MGGHRSLMDGRKHLFYIRSVQSEGLTFPYHPGKKVLPSGSLDYRHGMLFLDLSDQVGHLHPFSEKAEQAVIDRINAQTEFFKARIESLVVRSLGTKDKRTENPSKLRRSHLLGRIAQGFTRIAVGFHHQTIEPEVERPLGQILQETGRSAHVAWVRQERNIRKSCAHLHSQLPHRVIPVGGLTNRSETAVDKSDKPDALTFKSFHSSAPETQIRAERILHQYRNIHDTL